MEEVGSGCRDLGGRRGGSRTCRRAPSWWWRRGRRRPAGIGGGSSDVSWRKERYGEREFDEEITEVQRRKRTTDGAARKLPGKVAAERKKNGSSARLEQGRA